MKTSIQKMTRVFAAALLLVMLAACGQSQPKNKAVFLLLDTSGTYTEELTKAQNIINYLLATLNAGDSLAVARIDSGSFSEKDIIAKANFDNRPSTTSDQKRLFKHQIDEFVAHLQHGSANTDITGGVIQASDFVRETKAGKQYVFIFSDLEEDLPKGHIRNFPINVAGVEVIALNVTKLRSDNVDPRDYQKRLDFWQKRVIDGGGEWRVLNDLERLEGLIH